MKHAISTKWLPDPNQGSGHDNLVYESYLGLQGHPRLHEATWLLGFYYKEIEVTINPKKISIQIKKKPNNQVEKAQSLQLKYRGTEEDNHHT